MSYIGIKGAERLDKSNSSLCLLEAHNKAVHMLGNGADMHSIKLMTGWETGVDGKWRYEVADPFHTTTEIEDHFIITSILLSLRKNSRSKRKHTSSVLFPFHQRKLKRFLYISTN